MIMKLKRIFAAAMSIVMLCFALPFTVLPVSAVEGTLTIDLNPATGGLTPNLSAVTGDEVYGYTWSGDGVSGSTSTLDASTLLGKEITLTLNDQIQGGSLTARITVYQVTTNIIDNAYGDVVSLLSQYGEAGDEISISYNLSSGGLVSNTLTYSGVQNAPSEVTAATGTDSSGTSTYNILAADAEDGVITLTATFEHTDTVPLETPVLTATGGNEQVTLSWNDVAGTDTYRIYKSTAKNGSYTMLISGDINEVTDTGVINEQPYYYYVQALDTSPPTNQSLPSEPVQALPTNGHFGSYEYGVNAATITITDKSNDTVLTNRAFIEGTIDKTGTLELWVNGDCTQYPVDSNSFDVSFDLEVGRNDVTMYFNESGTGYVTRKTFNFVYLADYDILVDGTYAGGETDVPTYTTVQAAIDSVPFENSEPVVIFIKNGTYNERVVIDEPNISLIGEDSENTIIEYNINTSTAGALGGVAEYNRNVMKVLASAENFTAENFTIENTFSYNNGANQEADALAVFADKSIFVNLRLESFMNTLRADSSGTGTIARQYFNKCYITGNLNFIYGGGTALFEDCDIVARYTVNRADGSYVAGKQEDSTPYGYIFYDCRFLREAGIADDSYRLARPMGADAAATFVNCFMDSHIIDTAYGNLSGNFYENARFYEYYTYGPGFAVNNDRPLINEQNAENASYNIFNANTNGTSFNYETTLSNMYIPDEVEEAEDNTDTTDTTDNQNNSSSDSSDPPSIPNIPQISYPGAPLTPGETEEFTSKSGVTSTVTVTEDGVTVEAGLNKSGSVNSEATAAAVKRAAEIAKANGETSITIAIPEGATGLSKATIQKLVKAANGVKIVLALTSIKDGEEVGSISIPINSKTGQILTGLHFETENIKSAQDYIEKKWKTEVLGSFETAQKGGWGAVATLRVDLENLGFTADDGTKLYALIYDTKTGKWYQVPAEIVDGNVVIETKRTGVVNVVTDSVK
jgi:pectin methylesterase-like acyl-CoA thioesterase